MLMTGPAPSAWAVQRFENLTSVSQAYTTGYEHRVFTETSQTEAKEAFRPEAEREREAVISEEEAERDKDIWRYRHSITHGSTYDSNNGSDRNDPKDELSHFEALYLGMTRRQEHSYVDLFYSVAYTHQVGDEKSNDLLHTPGITWGYNLGRLNLTFSNTFSPKKSSVPGDREELAAVASSTTQRVTAVSDTFSADAAYRFSPKLNMSFKFATALSYLPTASNALGASNFSTLNYTYTPSLTYRWTPKTQFALSWPYDVADYYRGGFLGSKTSTPTIGITTLFRAKTRLSAQAGWWNIDYDRHELATQDGFLYSLALSRKLTPKITATASMTSRPAADVLSSNALDPAVGSSRTTSYGLDLEWELRRNFSLAAGVSAGYYESDRLVTRTDFDNPTQTFTRYNETQLYEWSASLNWAVRPDWTALLGYQYTNQNASFTDNETQNYRTVASLSGQF